MDSSATKITDKKKTASTVLMAFAATVFAAGFVGVSFPDMTSLLLIAVSSAACCISMLSSSIIVGILTVIPSFFLGALVTNSYITAILSVIYLPCAVMLYLISKGKIEKSTLVIISALGFTLGICSMLLVNVYLSRGDISIDSITAVYKDFFDQFRTILSTSFSLVIAGETVSYITDANINTYLSYFLSIFPGTVFAASELLACFCGFVYKFLLGYAKMPLPDTKRWKIRPTYISAIFFIFIFAFCAIFSSFSTLTVVSLNITVILLPLFLFAGIGVSFEPVLSNGVYRPRVFRSLALIITFFAGTVPFVIAGTAFGVFDSIYSAYINRKKSSDK